MKKFYSLFLSCSLICGISAQTIIDPVGSGGFDQGNTFAANGWSVANSSANKWVVGSTTYFNAPNSAYISADGDPANYSYDSTTAHISHLYIKVNIPANAVSVIIQFRLKGNVEYDSNGDMTDGMILYVDPSLTVPVADALPGGSAIPFWYQTSYNTNYVLENFNLNALAGKSIFLIFTWINNNNHLGPGPPASIDGVKLSYCIKNINYALTGGGGFCTGTDGVAVGLKGSVIGINYQLYKDGDPIGTPVPGTGTALNFGLQNQVGNYTVIGTSGVCSYTMPGSVTVTENPLPTATAGNNGPVCENATIDLNATGGSTYKWSGPNSFSSSLQNPVINNMAAADSGTYKVIVTDAKGCQAKDSTRVLIKPANSFSLTSATGTDDQSVCLNSAITNITYATKGATGASFTGLPAGVTGVWVANVITISGRPSTMTGTPFAYTITLTGGCGNTTINGKISVTTSGSISLSSPAGTDNQSVCLNSSLTPITYATAGTTGATFSGLPPGVSGNWASNVVTISGSPASMAGSPFTYSITLTGGCGAATATGKIWVTNANTIALSSVTGTDAQDACVNQPIEDIIYSTTGATGATFSGLPAGVSGTWAANKITITGSPTAATAGLVTYTITLTGGCGNAGKTGTIDVKPANIISLTSVAGSDGQMVCENSPLEKITYATTGATGATFNNLPPGITGTWAANKITISGSPTDHSGSPYKYTITLNGGCGNITASGNITVTPGNGIALTSATGSDNQAVCENSAITNITYSTTGATGVSFIGLPAGVNGSWSADKIVISGTPVSSAGSPYNFTITLTGGCGSISANGSITVNPPTSLNLTSAAGSDSQTVCLAKAINNITYSATGITGASASGLPAGVLLTPSPGVLTISGTPSVTGVFKYTINTTGGCGAGSASGTLIIPAAVNAGTIASVATCSGSSGSISLSGNSDPPTKWQFSLDSTASTWTDIVNTLTTQAFTNITVPTFYKAEVSNACGSSWSPIATVRIHNYWVGGNASKPNDWNTAANWSDNQVPSIICSEVFIPAAANNPVLNSAPTATIKDLHILSGGVLTINGTGLLQIAGTITNAGTLDVTDGSIEFNGTTSAQPVDGALFKNHTIKNLVISNNVNITATANDTVNILGNLTFGTASSVLNTGDNLTLKSSANNTANIGVMANGNSINGNVTVERYINTGPANHAKAWEFLATPVRGQSVYDSWMEKGGKPPGYGTQITGTGTGFDLTSPAPSMKYFDPASTSSWTGITNTGNEIYNPHGYMLFVRGDRTVSGGSTPANPTTLRITGKVNQHQQTMAVASNSFTSVGNPFASALDMRKVMADRSANVDDFFTIWNSNDAGNYGYGKYFTYLKSGTNYISVPGDGSVNNYIQSGQAFMVQNTSSSAGSLIFNEASKETANSGFLSVFRPAGATGKVASLRTNLYLTTGAINILLDGTLQQFSDRFDNGIDGLDGRKVNNTSENLSIISEGKQLIVERRQFPVPGDTVFYSGTSLKQGNYHFEFTANNLSGEAAGFLEDTYLKTQTPINPEGKTSVDFTVTADTRSSVSSRFRIIYKTMVALPVTIVSFTGVEENKLVHLQWQVANENNINKYQLEKSVDANHFSLLAERVPAGAGTSITYLATDESPSTGTNYYRLKIVDNNGKYVYSQVIKFQLAAQKSSITIYPNPITDGIIRLRFLNQPKGNYNIRLMNNLGQLIMIKQMVIQEQNTTVPINWNFNLSHGIYQLEIRRPDGTIREMKVIY
jgi:Secretion system C-terminal sorting domain